MERYLTESDIVKAVDTISDLQTIAIKLFNIFIEIMDFDPDALNFRSDYKYFDNYGKEKTPHVTGVNISHFDSQQRLVCEGFYKGTKTTTWKEPIYTSIDGGPPDLGDEFKGPSGWEEKCKIEHEVIKIKLSFPLWMFSDVEKVKRNLINLTEDERRKRKVASLVEEKSRLESSLKSVTSQIEKMK